MSGATNHEGDVPAGGKKGFLSKFRLPFLKKKEVFVRRHTRHDCCVIADMRMVERNFEMDGVILELSQGGVLFRPASTQIMDRQGELVAVRFEGREYTGIIMNTRPIGYGVRLKEEIDDDFIEGIIVKYGLRTIKLPQ